MASIDDEEQKTWWTVELLLSDLTVPYSVLNSLVKALLSPLSSRSLPPQIRRLFLLRKLLSDGSTSTHSEETLKTLDLLLPQTPSMPSQSLAKAYVSILFYMSVCKTVSTSETVRVIDRIREYEFSAEICRPLEGMMEEFVDCGDDCAESAKGKAVCAVKEFAEEELRIIGPPFFVRAAEAYLREQSKSTSEAEPVVREQNENGKEAEPSVREQNVNGTETEAEPILREQNTNTEQSKSTSEAEAVVREQNENRKEAEPSLREQNENGTEPEAEPILREENTNEAETVLREKNENRGEAGVSSYELNTNAGEAEAFQSKQNTNTNENEEVLIEQNEIIIEAAHNTIRKDSEEVQANTSKKIEKFRMAVRKMKISVVNSEENQDSTSKEKEKHQMLLRKRKISEVNLEENQDISGKKKQSNGQNSTEKDGTEPINISKTNEQDRTELRGEENNRGKNVNNLSTPHATNSNCKEKRSLMDRYPTARTFEWNDSIEGPSEEIEISISCQEKRAFKPKRKLSKPKRASNSETSNKKKRPKRKWTEEEVKALVKSVNEIGPGKWKRILEEFGDEFEDRTEVDLKDKWRNLGPYLFEVGGKWSASLLSK